MKSSVDIQLRAHMVQLSLVIEICVKQNLCEVKDWVVRLIGRHCKMLGHYCMDIFSRSPWFPRVKVVPNENGDGSLIVRSLDGKKEVLPDAGDIGAMSIS
jgi:hypothetical protein